MASTSPRRCGGVGAVARAYSLSSRRDLASLTSPRRGRPTSSDARTLTPPAGFSPPCRGHTTRFPGCRASSAAVPRGGRTRPNRRSSATACTNAESSSGRRGSRGRARGRRSPERAGLSAAMIASISASIAGSAMPARLFEPLSAAACEEKNERSESPGVAEKLKRSMVMSKSKPSRRARYCTGSTRRKRRLDAERRRDS